MECFVDSDVRPELQFLAVAPWDLSPTGVVSLLDMLKYAADDFWMASQILGRIIGNPSDGLKYQGTKGKYVTALVVHCTKMGLMVSADLLDKFRAEIAPDSPDRGMSKERISQRIEALTETLHSELKSRIFLYVPPDRTQFMAENWLGDKKFAGRWPEMLEEFQKAGRCFAYDENTASVFHLMRVADFCFRKVAESLGITYDAQNWQGIGKAIHDKMEIKYQQKSDDWKKQEPFYAEILTDIQALSRGHRNPVLHELEKKYEERETRYMLAVIEQLVEHVATTAQ